MFISRSLTVLALATTIFSCNQARKETADTHQSTDTTQVAQVGRCDTLMREYDFPSRRFDETAQDLAHATGCFIEADIAQIGATPVKAVRGRMSIYDALQKALEGTNLRITQHQPGQLKVERKP